MLSLFPQILFLAPLGLTLIRVAAGLTLMYIGWTLYREREAIARERFPIIGHCPVWLSLWAATIQTTIGIFLVVGLYTQVAALLAAVVALKCVIYGRRFEKIIPLSRAANVLLLAICLSLIVSGAGAFAFDMPL